MGFVRDGKPQGLQQLLQVGQIRGSLPSGWLCDLQGELQRVGKVVVVGDKRMAAAGQPLVAVDYAHTPDALDKALRALRPLAAERGGRLWCVFGCGGDRDPVKRPMMGAVAEQYADQVVLTSDNPRSESPAFILSQILAGVAGRDRVDVIDDRRDAIRHALRDAASTDVVLLAGKGHEETQEIAGVKTPFSDVDQAVAALAQRGDA